MKKSILLAFVLLLSANVFGQDDFSSSRLDTIVTRLKRESVDLSERVTDDLRRTPNAGRALIEEAFLASQVDASVGMFQDMVRDRRRAAELRDAGSILAELSRRAPATSSNGALWRSVQTSISDLNRELGASGGGGTTDRPVAGRVFWRGMVDDRLQLIVRGGKIESQTMSGRTMPDGTYSFTSPLPSREIVVGATRTRGRGTVKVLQQPSAGNDFTAIVEIYDDGGGARDYQIEIFWQ